MQKKTKIYIAADAGKYNTKMNAYDPAAGKQVLTKFRTKMSEGTFEDDMYERGTIIVQVDDGEVFKVGRDGKDEPQLETSKKSEIHRVCTMAAAAMACENFGYTETDADIVIGIPLQVCNIPKERLDYKKYMLGEPGVQHKVRLKTDCNGPVREYRITFGKELVYPEGIGVLYEYPSKLGGPTGIMDIGNLNTNNLYCDAFMINNEGCYTNEMGGKVLIAGLASTLTAELGARVDENMVASTLLRPYDQRYLHSTRGNHEVEEKSRKIIDRYMLEHVNAIRQRCDTKHWPLEFMDIVCMGGTAKLLRKEICEVFGKETFIPDAPEYVNVRGFLKKMCAGDGVDITKEENHG